MEAATLVELIRTTNDGRDDTPDLRKPILPPLPALVDLRKLPKPTDDSQSWSASSICPNVSVGSSWPSTQPAIEAWPSPAPRGPGSPLRCGAVAASVGLTKVEADRLPLIYGIDFGGGQLAPITGLPHVSTVAADAEGAVRILADLEHLYQGRRTSFANVGASSLADYRAKQQDDLVRQVFVLIDDFGAFHRAIDGLDDGRWLDVVQRILFSGSEVGIQFVLTATDQSDIRADLIPQIGRWMTLVGSGARGGSPLGRALVSENEVQLAVLDGATDPAAEAQALARLGEELLVRGATPTPAL